MRAANHHGRGTAKHAGREFDVSKAPHIDPAKCGDNVYWTWDGQASLEASERAYYQETFTAALDAQNEQHMRRRQYKRVRDMGQIYEGRNTQPEGSLLYIGCKADGPIDPAVLWACAEEYRAWEQDALGGHYVPLTMALHADERGQIHVEERGVYRYQDEVGNWQIGQAAALEAAGIPLPDPSQDRGKSNNRKMTWDAARREKWLDIVEAHGFKLEREPEAARPHLGLEAWQAWQDAKAALDAQTEQQRQTQAALDAQAAQQRRIDNAQRDRAARIGQQAQQVQAARESTKKWAADLTEWRDREQQRLVAAAAQVAKAATGSDAALLAELDRRRHKDGRTWREALLAEMESRAAAQPTQPITIKRPPGQDDIAAAMQLAQEQEQRRLQAQQHGKQLGG